MKIEELFKIRKVSFYFLILKLENSLLFIVVLELTYK